MTQTRAEDLATSHTRLEHLYEISKLLASSRRAEETFHPALSIATQTLPLHSVILIEAEEGRAKMIVWPTGREHSEEMLKGREHAEAVYARIVSRPPSEAAQLGKQGSKFTVIPLAVAQRPPFGALQLEGVNPLDQADLIFVNAIANQLAIALDRDRAWRSDITRREQAEEGRSAAESTGAKSERGRIVAETSSDKYEALAIENARLFVGAQQEVRVREQILAIVSHDLRNPLGTILMNTDALAQRPVAEERRRGLPQAVGRIQRAAERMVRLIEDLLDFASIEAGHLAIRAQPQDAGLLLREAHASFESVAREQELQMGVEIGPELPQIYCDRDRILQVLSNLIGNATKVVARKGQIRLRVEARGAEVLFSVADDGHGISPSDAKHLFDRYWRSGEVDYKGTGLGLAIARGIVVAHNGRIWAESEPGQGATFYFTIPAADPAAMRADRKALRQLR